MKKLTLFVTILLIVGSAFPITGFSQGKIGHLNSDELVRAMPETDSINKILSDLEAEYRKIGEELGVGYNRALEAYNTQMETLKPIEKKLKETELLDMQKRIQTFTTDSENEYQKRRQELYAPVLLKAQNAIQQVGKENGFLYVLDSAQGLLLLIPDDESLNLLPLVKQKLGIKTN